MESLGFIGMGNMAQALAQGFIASGALKGERVFAYAPHQEKLRANAERIGFQAVASLTELAAAADTLVMACKPYQIESVVAELGDALSGKALVSIAAGWDFARYESVLPQSTRFQFVMPNTPAMVREGVLLFEEKTSLEPAERKALMDLFATVGVVEEVPSALMAAAGTVTGCGPAFVDLMIEAYADAAVKYGVPREQAYALVAQMVKGSAALALETKEQPGVLKDAVCSPGGTTIRGVCSLEEDGFRAACIHSIDAILE
ncbi:MAG: pyrroline-5-carboxylate reductase [Atopobiaceae bacterium]|jgi:pyrroline-5-carboxylate reductase|nr:pyrroline-5-carboxylate reductase [Atopobiaceae bacterium]MCI1540751.1 pyrroline-5-carboxylate reductase [Atopobiaceae bacterium]